MKIARILGLAAVSVAIMLLLSGCNQPVTKKPAIYLYPETEQTISVRVDFEGEMTTSYPEYTGDWQVIAHPDGTLLNLADNREYSYLFWEGILADNHYDMSKGFVVAGKDTKDFLQEKLATMGLTPKEYNDFIVYWLPQMQGNNYNLITFVNEEYAERVRLRVDPTPDSVIRVLMVYKPLSKYVEVEPQELRPVERSGFTVVEWGGMEL